MRETLATTGITLVAVGGMSFLIVISGLQAPPVLPIIVVCFVAVCLGAACLVASVFGS